MPVLRDVGHIGIAPPDRGTGDILAAQRYPAGDRRLQPGKAVNEFGLAVAVDARNADDLAPAYLQADVLYGVILVDLAGDGHLIHLQHHLARLCGLFGHVEVDLMADHHGAEFLHVGVFGFHGADVLALAQHGAAVGNRHDLIELVGNKEDGFPLGGQVFHNDHQLVDLLRGQNRRRLIEDQDLIFPVQHFQDLGALLHSHGDVLDDRIRVDPHPVLFAQFQYAAAGLLFLQHAVFGRLHAQDDIIQDRKALHQLEVLVHHADPQRIGVIGVFDGHLFAILFDDPLLRLIQSEQHTHQGGFPGAVFSQQRMDLALFELQGNVIIGDNSRKPLCDVQHLYCIRCVQAFALPSACGPVCPGCGVRPQ